MMPPENAENGSQAANPSRTEAEEVEEAATIVRLLPFGTVDDKGELQASAFSPTGSKGPQDSGPSLYVLDRLPNGVGDLEVANPKWLSFGYATCRAAALREKGLRIVYTPSECPFPSVAHAHASITNLTKLLRAEILPILRCGRVPARK